MELALNFDKFQVMNEEEMEKIEGGLAFLPIAARYGGGALIGATAAAYGSWANTGRVNWRQVAGGAVIGATGAGYSRFLSRKGW